MDTDKRELGAELALAALDEVPKAKADAREIVAVVKHRGKIEGYQLSDGQTVTKDEGVAMAKAGNIKGVGVSHRKDTEYLKSLPDGTEDNNLSSLPKVKG